MSRSHDRRPENTNISVSLPKDLVNKLDEASIREHRSRSNMITVLLKEALEKNKFTREQILTFPSPMITHMRIVNILAKYVDRYDPLDKLVFAGYGCRFDMDFLRAFFGKNNDPYFASWFYSLPMDVMSFVAEAVYNGRMKPRKHKLL